MPVLFQIGVTCAAFGLVCFGFANWKRHYMRYFFCMSVSVFLSSAGYAIERLAPNFDSAFIGTELAYLGVPFLGGVSTLPAQPLPQKKKFFFLKNCLTRFCGSDTVEVFSLLLSNHTLTRRKCLSWFTISPL
jgi:hypothetical protein